MDVKESPLNQIIKSHSRIIPRLTHAKEAYIEFVKTLTLNYSQSLPQWVKKKLYYQDLLNKLEDVILLYCRWNQRTISEEFTEMSSIVMPNTIC